MEEFAKTVDGLQGLSTCSTKVNLPLVFNIIEPHCIKLDITDVIMFVHGYTVQPSEILTVRSDK